MASGKSGSFELSTSGYTAKISWLETYDIANNTSIISITSLEIKSSWYYGVIYYPNGHISVNGINIVNFDSVSGTHFIGWNNLNSYGAVGSSSNPAPWSSEDIVHNDDGNKSVSIEIDIYGYTKNGDNGSGWHISGSKTISLTAIPRESSISSANNLTLGNKCNITFTPASSTFYYNIRFSLGDWYANTGLFCPGQTTSYTYSDFVVNGTDEYNGTTIYEQLPSSISGIMTATLTTYSSNSVNSQIGSGTSKTFMVTIPSGVVPTVGNIILEPTIINNKNILLQGKNKLTITASDCIAGTGSEIKSYTFSGPSISKTISSNSSEASTYISSVTDINSFTNGLATLEYQVTVTDERGRSATGIQTITCYEYYIPFLSNLKIYRANSDGTENVNGTYIHCTYVPKYASVDSTNSISVKAYYNDGTTTQSVVGTNTEALINLNGNTSATYKVYLTITDMYEGSKNSSIETIFGETRILNITKDGTGIAIGKMAESNNLFECRWDAKFDGMASGPSGFSTSSDERIKKNIQEIGIDVVDNLRPIQYELIQDIDKKIHYGFIAQDVEKLLYNVGVDPNSTGIIGHIINNGRQEYVLTYTEFIPLLTKKCQDLQTEINMLKQEIIELKNMIK